jgi:hypothetical protein
MFANDYQENITGIVEITDITCDVFKDLLKFIYTAQLDKTTIEQPALLFNAAEKVISITNTMRI